MNLQDYFKNPISILEYAHKTLLAKFIKSVEKYIFFIESGFLLF
jgi:hypothetical protein